MTSGPFDVAVVGGGSAGIAAAITAARSGAETLLVERGALPGGNATGGLVHSICGLYRINPSGAPQPANPGFPQEFLARLRDAGGASEPELLGRVHVVFHDPAIFGRVAIELAGETAGLTTLFTAECRGVRLRKDRGIETLDLVHQGRHCPVRVEAVVDASGDAAAAARIPGAATIAPSHLLQRPAYIFQLANVSSDLRRAEIRLGILRRIHKAAAAGALPQDALGVSLRPALDAGKVSLTLNLSAGGAGYDPCDAELLASLEQKAHCVALDITAFLTRQCAGFDRAAVAMLPDRIGVRESRRLVGKYCLTGGDIDAGRRFADEVALATWPVELWETATGVRLRYPRNDAACGIPRRSLESAVCPNLFAAGRCLATDHEAQASTRVIGTCLATGEAAGRAASDLARRYRRKPSL